MNASLICYHRVKTRVTLRRTASYAVASRIPLLFSSANHRCWWAQVDSNHRPRAYQARALTTWAMSPFSYYGSFLLHLVPLVEMMGIEPMTPCLQGRCSPSWATPPYILWDFILIGHWKLNNRRVHTSTLLTIRLFGFHLLEYEIFPRDYLTFSIERRWSSRTFRYGYLVTT